MNTDNKKIVKLSIVNIILFVLAVLFLGIGYAQIAGSNLSINSSVSTSEVEDIFITDVTVNSSKTTSNASGTVNSYFNTTMDTKTVLSSSSTESYVTYNVNIINNTSEDYIFSGVVTSGSFYVDDKNVENTDITYELDGLEIGDTLKASSDVDFTVKFKYKDGVDTSSLDKILSSYLNFEFVKKSEISLIEITLDNQSATTAGTASIFEWSGKNIYLDNSLEKTMTTSSNAITVPKKDGYKVTFDANGGTVTTASKTATTTFGGYYSKTNGSGDSLISSTGYITSKFTNTYFTGASTIYAKWKYGSIVTETPTRTGYTFAGWYDAETDGNLVIGANTVYTPSKDITLYAHWTPNKLVIKMNMNGGIMAASHSTRISTDGDYVTVDGSTAVQTINYGEELESTGLPNVNNANYINITKLGYTVKSGKEFNTKADGTGTTYSQVTVYDISDLADISDGDKTVELYVNWITKSYKITYNLDNGTVATANPTSYNIESNAITLNNPTKTGYTFAGWTEQITNFTWNLGFVNQTTGALEKDSTYTKAYYTDLIYLEKGKTYTLSGYDTYSASNIRWRVYNTDGAYIKNGSSSDSYTATDDCYVRILYIAESTSTQRSGTIMTSGTKETTEVIPTGSTERRTFTANWTANELVFANKSISKTFSTENQTFSITTASNGTGTYTYEESSEKDASGTATDYMSLSGTTVTIAENTPVGTYSYVVKAIDSNSGKTKEATYTITIGKATMAAPTVTVSTAGVVKWADIAGATGYEISFDNSTWADATSGTNYKSSITTATGTRTVYVRAVSTSSNYNTPSSTGSKSVTVYKLTLSTGTGISKVTGGGNYISGASVSIKATLSTGYTFSSWSTTSTKTTIKSSTSASTTATVKDNATIAAAATANTYTITLAPNGGTYNGSTANSTLSATYNEDVNIGYPTRTGYTFTGWKDSTGNIYDHNLLNGYTAPSTIGSSSSNSAGTWRTASTSGGTRSVISISSAPLPGITKGFEILGDGKNRDISQDAVPVTSGNKYTISVWAKGTGTLTLQAGNSSYGSKSFTLSDVTEWTKYSWTFTAGTNGSANNGQTNIYFGNRGASGTLQLCGMKLEEGTGFKDNLWSNTAADTTLTAQWTANELIFADKSISKTFSTSAQTFSVTAATNGTGTYTYAESSETKDGTATSYITLSGTTGTIAKNTPAGTYEYKITATDSNSKATKEATYTITIGKATMATPTVTVAATGVVTWTTVTGATSYEISFDNTNWEVATSGTNYKTSITTATGTRTVYVRAVSTSSNYNTPSSTGSSSVTVYALTLSKGTGISKVTGGGNYISGGTATIIATVSTGYTFSQWSTASTATEITDATTASTTATVGDTATITAAATINTYTISYTLNSGSYGTSHPTTATYNKSFTVSNPTRSGYTFTGWKITGMDTVTHTYGTSTTTATSISSTTATSFKNLRSTSGTVTFTAQWVANNYEELNGTTHVAYYEHLSEALSAVQDGETIKVLNGITENASATLESGKTVTLNTNAKTTTMSTYNITNSGVLTITGTGTITSANTAETIDNATSAELTLESATLKNTSTTGAAIDASSTTNINSGSVIGTYDGIKTESVANLNINIAGGTVTGTNHYGIGPYGIMNITGGTISGTYGIYQEIGTITITGGIIMSTSTAEPSAAIRQGTYLTITDATIRGGYYGIHGTGVSGYNTILNGKTAIVESTYGVQVDKDSEVVVNDNVTIEGTYTGIISLGGKVTVNSCTLIKGTADNGIHMNDGYGGTCKIYDGSVWGNVNGIYNGGSANVYIYGGTVTSSNGSGTGGAGAKNYTNATGRIYVGKSTDAFSTSTPVVQGAEQGLSNESEAGAKIYFYNGIIKSQNVAVNGTFAGIRSGYVLVNSSSGASPYIYTAYLEPES